MALFAILIALSTVFAHFLTQQLNPLLMAFYSFSFAFVTANLMRLRNTKNLYIQVIQHWKVILAVNLSTAIDWILIFIALNYITGSLVNCIVFGVAPLATLFLSFNLYLSKKLIIKDLLITVFIFLILSILSILYYDNTIQPLDRIHLIMSIILCVLSGIATGFTAVLCKMLHKRNFGPLAITKTRFILLIMASFTVIVIFKINMLISYQAFLLVVLLGFLFILLPSFFLQKGLENTSAVTAVIISASVPAMTYFFQLLDPRYHLRPLELLLVSLLSIAIYLSIRLGASNEKITH